MIASSMPARRVCASSRTVSMPDALRPRGPLAASRVAMSSRMAERTASTLEPSVMNFCTFSAATP
jgi:hypothetical protein